MGAPGEKFAGEKVGVTGPAWAGGDAAKVTAATMAAARIAPARNAGRESGTHIGSSFRRWPPTASTLKANGLQRAGEREKISGLAM
jgi:hypothetical protein